VHDLIVTTYHDVRAALLAREEIALLDVREEDPFAQSHPLWAANLPWARIERDAWQRIPRCDTRIVVYDDGEGLAASAMQRLRAIGYSNVSELQGGLAGWRDAGGELFRDVNVPSKSFGELVESQRHTPSLPAEEVKALLDAKADVVVLDARRFDEYNTMSIPTGISVPGAELVLRARALAPDPKTRVIVNCAGRTRSIIGTQSLVNAGLPNPVAALRNGTIGWTLAGKQLDKGQMRRAGAVDAETRAAAQLRARRVADAAGVGRVEPRDLESLEAPGRTLYRFDVRHPEEYDVGHLPGFLSAPGGQLVQETDHFVPVRGARIVLVDDDGVRANMTASWLAQMGWDVHLLDGVLSAELSSTDVAATRPALPTLRFVRPQQLADWLATDGEATQVIDMSASAGYVKQHIPGAWFALRSQLPQALKTLPPRRRLVLTCRASVIAAYTAGDDSLRNEHEVWVLEGGNLAWIAAGLPTETGQARLASPPIDRYRRPYEGTDNAAAAMQAYLDWEFGLVAQLARDGTHGFNVLSAEAIAQQA
jgi:rhodanese-related sulfurtransferase